MEMCNDDNEYERKTMFAKKYIEAKLSELIHLT